MIGRCPYFRVQTPDDVTGKLFSLFCPTWRAVLKMFARLFRCEGLENSLAGAVYKREKEETKAKSFLVDLKMLKLEQNFKTAANARKRLTVLKIFTRLFLFEQEKASGKV